MFTRRKLLKLTAGVPLLSPLAPKSVVAQGLGTDYDVIVLGAGVAGLAAAERLVSLDSELKVLVLEARDRIGGRVYSVKHQSSARDADLGSMFLSHSQGASWPVIDRLGLTVEEFPNGSLGLYPGMVAFVRALAETSTGRVQLDSEVSEVFWREGLVGVKYMNRGLSSAVTGRRMIVTLPTGVLRSGAVSMTPGLPATKLNALNALAVEPALSFSLLFPSGSASLKDESHVWVFEDATTRLRASREKPSDDLLLEAQFRGVRADALAQQPESLQFSLAIRAFAEAFDTLPALGAATWSEAVDWRSDKFSRGSSTQAGTTLAHLELAKSMGDTVFFAGEATADPRDVGTVHGAYDSGERAAREVALSLNLESDLADPNEPILELL